MIRILRFFTVMTILSLFVLLGNGCSSGDYLDPTQIGRFKPVPSVNIILDSLGVAEETPSTFVGAEEPKPMDAIAYETDYVFNSGDMIRISVYELEQEGQTYINDFMVTETGKISIPQVGQIQAAGLMEMQLEEEIIQTLSPAILKEPLVMVMLMDSESRSFTVLGEGVTKPGRYKIPRCDFRLADALAVAGSPKQFNVSFIYVTRNVTGKEMQMHESLGLNPSEKRAPSKDISEDETMQSIHPHAMAPGNKKVVPETPAEVPVQPKSEAMPEQKSPAASKEKVSAMYGLEQIGSGGQQRRVIKIPAKEFLGGDSRYNIIIKPSDVISVPVDVVGEFYVLGNANNQGVIPLTGRPMTLMQSMAAAGGLGPLAWPERVEVRRRIGEKKEEIVLVNLKKIADGSQPDFFIKPNDLVNIGTHPGARWLAVLRNAFRATYGFGFIYDRNFADRDFGGNPLPF